MEAVSAVKMRKSQSAALAARPYATAALNILKNLEKTSRLNLDGDLRFNLLAAREAKNVLLVVVTSDKGLAGPFNANVLKEAERFIQHLENPTILSRGSVPRSQGAGFIRASRAEVRVATVGKKASEYFSRRGRTPAASWTGFGDYASVAEVEPVFEAVLEAFTNGTADEVHIIYTNFLSAMKQEVVARKLLPFSEEGLEEMVKGIVPERGRFAKASVEVRPQQKGGLTSTELTSTEYLFEPSPEEVFDAILPALLKIEVFHAILEANASEHSSRMVAMRNATDNAGELIKSYTVSLNKARQSAINKELAEITGGSEALAN